MGQNHLALTKTAILNLPVPERRTRIADRNHRESVNGLFVYLTPSGSKTFYYRRRLDGKYVEVKIGIFPDMTVDNARRKAKELAVQFDRGINPNYEKQMERAAETIDDLFINYLELFKLDIQAGTRRASSLRGSETLYRLHISPVLGKIKYSALDKARAKRFLQTVLKNKGYSMHNHCLTLLKSMFNRADLPNPLIGINKIDEALHRRERVLSRDELQKLFTAMEEEEQIYQDVILLLLLTAQRKASVLSMEWNEINAEQKAWVIPISKIKSKKPHVVPLSDKSMEILTRRFSERSPGERFVFPSPTSKTGHISEKSGAQSFWRRVTKRAGLYSKDRKQSVRIHDLRRTMATMQVSRGGSLQATSKLLGHSSIGITNDVYAHLELEAVRQELQQTTEVLFSNEKQ
ncbi:tyrosine-type recombinase/integrase [Vibrio mytili]|uniref:tyrosine-type recombinase/integrase n=1 Tax=Vibrio mytili TaxID=50718 RepID=UPI0006983A6A|nr:site-specific integrase [Vibrio mytili]